MRHRYFFHNGFHPAFALPEQEIVYDNGSAKGIIAPKYVHLLCRVVRCSFRAVNVPRFPFVDPAIYAFSKLAT